jgi:hypothetical protein
MSALVDASALAEALGVSRDYVYEHADQLGAVQLGDGPKARKRFDVDTARAALACYASKRSQPLDANAGAKSAPPAPQRRGSLATRRPLPGSLLADRPRRPQKAI